MNQNRITQLDLNDVPKVYHNLKYNDGEIIFADDITSIPGLMKKFQVNFIAYVMVLNGTLSLDLNATTFHLKKNCSLIVDRKVVIDNIMHSDDFSCLVCGISTNVGFSFINKSLMQSVMHILSNPVIEMGQDDIDLMVKYYDLLTFKMDHPEMNFGHETMREIIRCFAYDLLSNINKHINQDGEEDMLRQGDRIFRRFMLMLADSSSVNRSVKSYADELCVSPKYLTSVCRKHSDYTASELIATAVISRIKQMLLFSDKSIKEVASEMGFDNLSFFGKYVKKHLGLSPNHYRKANNYGK
ncbi:MAG: helix-turn-helix domain-containing protein [Bacteroidales bacterium]|jgi:AraC-like DNA-binding protein|nr:helix-turn-helix domain-containing protein [Bacteroidales bacterium]